MHRHVLIFLLCLGLLSSPCIADDAPIIRLATTTSTENSGLLQALLPAFEAKTGYRIHVIAVGTGKALRMGRDGDVDVLLVHAPNAERAFVAAGAGLRRHPVMHNDFLLVGPADDPAGIKNLPNAAAALRQIASSGATFISRGDDSGTHKKELALWQAAGVQPTGRWYREAGQGMGKVLQMANELDAYTLTDRGTWLAYRSQSVLQPLVSGDETLHNPYSLIAVNPKRYPDINHRGAAALIDWLTGKDGQQRIAHYRLHGEQLFHPDAMQLAQP